MDMKYRLVGIYTNTSYSEAQISRTCEWSPTLNPKNPPKSLNPDPSLPSPKLNPTPDLSLSPKTDLKDLLLSQKSIEKGLNTASPDRKDAVLNEIYKKISISRKRILICSGQRLDLTLRRKPTTTKGPFLTQLRLR